MPKLFKKRKSVIAQLLATSLFFFWAFASFGGASMVFADTVTPATGTVNVTLSDGITIRVLDSTATSDLEDLVFDFTPTDNGVSSTKNAIVEVGTSNETGYTLYMQSDWRIDNTSSTGRYKDDTSEAEFTTSLIHSGATSTPAIEDSIPTRLDNTYPFWYYYNNLSSSNKVIPEYGNPDTLAETREATDSSLTTVPITVGVDTSIVSGTYRNKLVFTAVGNQLPVDYIVHFDTNTSDTVSGIPEDLEDRVIATSKKFTLPDTEPSRSGFGFLGWDENPNAVTATYQPGDEITLIADNQSMSTNQTSEKTLYAIWGNFWSIHYMQDMRPEVCNSVYTPSNVTGSAVKLITSEADYTATTSGTAEVPQSTLYDIRDGKSYLVRKLADGNCWMVSNLRLGSSEEETVLDSKTSDIQEGTFTLPIAQTYDAQYGDWQSYGVSHMAIQGNYEKHGYFYNWHAATIGSTASSGDAPNSACPKKWRLPAASMYSNILSIYNLTAQSAANVSIVMGLPFSFTYGGYIAFGGQLAWPEGTSQQTGDYLSSTIPSANNRNSFYFTTNWAGWGQIWNRVVSEVWLYGNSVRCVSRS